MFVEGVAGLLDNAERLAGMEITKGTRPDAIRAKLAAASLIPALRNVLYPEDEDG